MSDSWQSHGLQPTRLLCPWDSLGKNTNGLPCPSRGDLPNREIELASLTSPALAGVFFITRATWEDPHEVRDVILPGTEPQIPFGLCVLSCFSCVQLCDPMDWSLPGSPVHGSLQTRVLEWVAILFSRRSSWPQDWTQDSYEVSFIGRPVLYL